MASRRDSPGPRRRLSLPNTPALNAAVAALTPTTHAPWLAYAGMLLRRRRGLAQGQPLPVIGRTTGSVTLTAAWLRDYRELIGLPDQPAVLPPLVLQLAAAPLHLEILGDRRFPFRAMGLVHVGQRVDQVCGVLPGSVLQLDACTGRVWPARSGMHLELVTEARHEGRLVWRSITTALARQRHPQAFATAMPAALDAPSSVPRDGVDWLRVELVRAPEDLGRRYASVAGDWNPIHQRAWLARRFGFERAIVHGTWTLARAMVAAGWPGLHAFSLSAQFRKPVMLPSSVAIWVHKGPSVQWLRVTDTEGAIEHLVARLEPALARDA